MPTSASLILVDMGATRESSAALGVLLVLSTLLRLCWGSERSPVSFLSVTAKRGKGQVSDVDAKRKDKRESVLENSVSARFKTEEGLEGGVEVEYKELGRHLESQRESAASRWASWGCREASSAD